MKRFQSFTGGHKYRNDDIQVVQDGAIEAFEGVCKGLGLGNTTYILQGATWLYLGGATYTVSAGYIYHNGVIYPVDAHTPTYNGNTLYWQVVTEILPPSPVTYADLSTKNCHIRERMELVDSAVPPAVTYALENSTRPLVKFLGNTPVGGIIMYSGSVADFSGGLGKKGTAVDGWALCDGSNGTPDLKGRFVVGYDSTDSDYNAIGNSAGAKTKDLRHRHIAFQRDAATFEDTFLDSSDVTDNTTKTSLTYSYSNYSTGANDFYPIGAGGLQAPLAEEFYTDTAGSQTQDIRPPYYTLAYIMKMPNYFSV